jgi:hypothetical protein
MCYNIITKRKDGTNQMEFRTTHKVVMTQEQHETLKKAVDILTDIEMDFTDKDLDTLQEKYEEQLDFVPHTKALPTAIDYIGCLLELTEIVEDTEDEEDDD